MTQVLAAATKTVTTQAPARTHSPLTARDRCDAGAVTLGPDGQVATGGCGAQAFIRAVLPSGLDLLFCNHHGSKYADALTEQGATIINESERINRKPTDPSKVQGF